MTDESHPLPGTVIVIYEDLQSEHVQLRSYAVQMERLLVTISNARRLKHP